MLINFSLSYVHIIKSPTSNTAELVVNSSNTSTLNPFFLKKSYKLFINVVFPVRGVPVNSITYGTDSNNSFNLYNSSFL